MRLASRPVTRRSFIGLMSVAGLGLASIGCSTAPTSTPAKSTPAKPVVVGILAEPNTLDPFIVALDTPSSQVMGNVYEALLDQDFAKRATVPMLAEKWEQRGPTTWAFKLREGVQFHKDYGELTADDVVFNVELTINEKKPRLQAWSSAKGAKAVSKYEVEIYLQNPDMPFLLSAVTPSFGYIASKRAIQEMGFERFQRNPVGTGPFQFERWTTGSEIVLKRFAKYRESGLPKVDEIVFRPSADLLVRRAQLERGELDFVDQVDFKDVPALQSSTSIKLSSSTGWNWDYISFNLKSPNAPWTKKEVRQAIAYAINREAIAKEVTLYAGQATPTDDPLPPGFMAYKDGPWKYPYAGDVETAKRLMQQAGHGSGFTIACITSNKPSLRREMEMVADQLKAIGVKMDLQGLDLATFNAKAKAHELQMALEDINVTSPDSDRALYQFFHPTGPQNHGYENKQVADKLDQARVESDNAKREVLYQSITQQAVEDASYIFTEHVNLVRAMNAKLAGFPGSPQEGKLFFRTLQWEA